MIERAREAVRAPRSGPIRQRRDVRDQGRVPGAGQHPVAQRGRREAERQPREQGGGADPAAALLAADRALVQMPAEPLAQQRGERAVPPGDQFGELGAVLLAGPGDHDDCHRPLELGTSARARG